MENTVTTETTTKPRTDSPMRKVAVLLAVGALALVACEEPATETAPVPDPATETALPYWFTEDELVDDLPEPEGPKLPTGDMPSATAAEVNADGTLTLGQFELGELETVYPDNRISVSSTITNKGERVEWVVFNATFVLNGEPVGLVTMAAGNGMDPGYQIGPVEWYGTDRFASYDEVIFWIETKL